MKSKREIEQEISRLKAIADKRIEQAKKNPEMEEYVNLYATKIATLRWVLSSN